MIDLGVNVHFSSKNLVTMKIAMLVKRPSVYRALVMLISEEVESPLKMIQG